MSPMPADGTSTGSADPVGGPPTPVRSPAPTLPHFHIRYGRLRDAPTLVRLYRGQSARSRSFYHPFPFDRPRLVPIFLWLVVARHFVLWTMQHLPRVAAILLVVVADGSERPVGYATVRYVARRGEETWAKFGYMIEERYQGLGVGRALSYWTMRSAAATGIRLGGGPVLGTNTVQIGLTTGLGYSVAPTDEEDRGAPGVKSVMIRDDLQKILAGLDARGEARTSTKAIIEFQGTLPKTSAPIGLAGSEPAAEP